MDLDGHATLPDVANGAYLQPGADGAVVVRNPGDALTARLARRVNSRDGRASTRSPRRASTRARCTAS
ncbi:MAG: hypothetical protein U0325_15750 [Polyangiales bacterium]